MASSTRVDVWDSAAALAPADLDCGFRRAPLSEKYDVGRVLGEGGFGLVRAVTLRSSGAEYACKVCVGGVGPLGRGLLACAPRNAAARAGIWSRWVWEEGGRHTQRHAPPHHPPLNRRRPPSPPPSSLPLRNPPCVTMQVDSEAPRRAKPAARQGAAARRQHPPRGRDPAAAEGHAQRGLPRGRVRGRRLRAPHHGAVPRRRARAPHRAAPLRRGHGEPRARAFGGWLRRGARGPALAVGARGGVRGRREAGRG
jgi:hypothetical protein